MHIGEYCEVKFPSVVSTIVTQSPIETMKEKTPSPVDLLCTTKHSEKKKFRRSVPKLPASCTVSEDPHDVLRYVPESTTAQLKLTLAHHVAKRSMLSPKQGDLTANFMSTFPAADLTLRADGNPNFCQVIKEAEVGMGSNGGQHKMKKHKRKRTRSGSEPVIVISSKRKRRNIYSSTKSRLVYLTDNTAHPALLSAKNRRTSLPFQFGGKSTFTSTPAISALQSVMLCSGNVTGDSCSAYSAI